MCEKFWTLPAIRVVNEISAAGKHNRNARTKDEPCCSGVGEVDQLLGQHVAGLKIGHEQNVGVARDWRDDALLTGGIRVDRIVKSKRPVDLGAGDLAARHMTVSAAALSVAGILKSIVSTAASTANSGSSIRSFW